MYEQYVFSGVIGTPASSAERVCLVVHKVDFVWHSLTGRMLCRELHFKMPAQLSCRFDLAGLCVCVYRCVLWFSRPVSCIFAMSLKPESINLTIPAMGVTSMFECLFLCWPGYTEHPLSLSRKTSCPVRVIQWKYATVSSTALFARLQIITSPLAGGFLCFGWGNRQLHSDISDDTKKFSVTELTRWLNWCGSEAAVQSVELWWVWTTAKCSFLLSEQSGTLIISLPRSVLQRFPDSLFQPRFLPSCQSWKHSNIGSSSIISKIIMINTMIVQDVI